MGTWGETAFQNDSALDWLRDLERLGPAHLRETLSRVAGTHEDDFLDVDEGASAIAAAEIVAAALCRGRDRLPSAAVAWLAQNPGAVTEGALASARRAVQRVLADGSELRALWDEGGADNAWRAEVQTLLKRLGGPDGAVEAAPVANVADRQSPAIGLHEKQGLVTFLQARGLEPTAEQLERIQRSTDLTELRRWLARAVSAPSVAAVLDD